MQVKVAKSAGFCFGVQRAVDTVYEQVEKGIRPIYTYGPIIHNEVVVQDLEETFASPREVNLKLNPEKCVFGIP